MKEVAAISIFLIAFGGILPETSRVKRTERRYTFTFEEMGIETTEVFLTAEETGNFTVESSATRCNATVRLCFETEVNMTATLTINGGKETVTLRPAQRKRNVTLSPPLKEKNRIEVSLTAEVLTTATLYDNSTLTVYPIGGSGSSNKQSKILPILTGVGISVLTLPILLLIFLTRRKRRQLEKEREEKKEVYVG